MKGTIILSLNKKVYLIRDSMKGMVRNGKYIGGTGYVSCAKLGFIDPGMSVQRTDKQRVLS